MTDWIASAFLLIGVSLALLASVGVLRMPDLYTRMQTSTKASTLGVTCILIATAVHFHDVGVSVRVGLIIAFFFLSGPVAAHAIARAAYLSGIPLWRNSVVDELEENERSAVRRQPPHTETTPNAVAPPFRIPPSDSS